MIGSFGDIIFEVSAEKTHTFRDFSITSGARTATHDVIGSKPSIEFLGSSLEEISFTMQLKTSLGIDPVTAIEKFKKMQSEGIAESFIIGEKVIGQDLWIIDKVSESWNIVLNSGKVVSANIDITLKEYISGNNNKVELSTSYKILTDTSDNTSDNKAIYPKQPIIDWTGV